MLHNSAETRILPSPSMKLKVNERTIRDGLCIHASVQGHGLGISSQVQVPVILFPQAAEVLGDCLKSPG